MPHEQFKQKFKDFKNIILSWFNIMIGYYYTDNDNYVIYYSDYSLKEQIEQKFNEFFDKNIELKYLPCKSDKQIEKWNMLPFSNPTLFDLVVDSETSYDYIYGKYSCLKCSIEIGEGWLPILDESLDMMTKVCSFIEINQVKEKFNFLNIYWSFTDDVYYCEDEVIKQLQEKLDLIVDYAQLRSKYVLEFKKH